MADDEKLVDEILDLATGDSSVSDGDAVDIDALFASMAADAEIADMPAEEPVEEPAAEPVVEQAAEAEAEISAEIPDIVMEEMSEISDMPEIPEMPAEEPEAEAEAEISAEIPDMVMEEMSEIPEMAEEEPEPVVEAEISAEIPDMVMEEMSEIPEMAEEEPEPVVEAEISAEIPDMVMEEMSEISEMPEIPEMAEEEPASQIMDDIASIVNEMDGVAPAEEEFTTENIEAMLDSLVIPPAQPEEEASTEQMVIDPVTEIIAPAAMMDNPILDDIPEGAMTETTKMSVEDIVAEVNDTNNKKFDFSSCFEISIGENGGSYIALNLKNSALGNVFDLPSDGNVSVMFMGNCISIASEGKILKKNLLTGETTEKSVSDEVIESMNRSIVVSSSINSERVSAKPELTVTINALLSLSADSSVELINGSLRDAESRLSISITPDGALEVSDGNGIVHSLEEILWILSF